MPRLSPASFLGAAAALAAAMFAACATPPQAAPPAAGGPEAACVVAPPPDSLWSLAQCCYRDLRSNPGCRYYSAANDFIILKDNSPEKPAAYLIIPTMRVTGIEDRQVFAPPVAGLWAEGWRQAQIYLEAPPANTGLAINSVFGRTQNQLHIHISCLRRDVARALAENAQRIGADPAQAVAIALGPHHNIYRAITVTSLADKSPFMLAAAMSGARGDMAAQSIAVAGSSRPGVFFVLDTGHQGSNPGAAEALLDQSCGAA